MSLCYMVKRNMLLYFKDRAAVFFSLLSVLIVLMLMVVFLGDMNKNELLNVLQQIRGSAPSTADAVNAQHVILMWTIAGMLAVNSFTVPLSIIGLYVQDMQYHKLESFFCAPISRTKLLCGYLIAAIINGMIMCSITLLLSYCYVTASNYSFLSLMDWIRVYGILLLSVSVSSCLILLISQFVHTSNAWGSLGTIFGTLIGFLGGIYLPMAMLPEFVQNVLKGLPFLHEASMLRNIFTHDAVEAVFRNLPGEIVDMYNQSMGIRVEMFQHTISIPVQVLALLLCGIIALCAAVLILKRHAPFDK